MPWRLVRVAVLGGLLVIGVQNLSGIGTHLGALFGSLLTGDVGAEPRDAQPTLSASSPDGSPAVSEGLDCTALSAERLATYVKVPVSPWNGEDGTCRWLADSNDPESVILTAEQVDPASLEHLSGETVRLSASASLSPPGPTSILLGRPGQWIPVADTRTEARWAMRLEIHRGRLGIDDRRGQQILRAAAADLNAAGT